MNGPEHYRKAEILLGNLRDEMSSDQQKRMTGEAQAHATLALVAAQIEAVTARGPGDCDQTWVDAIWRAPEPASPTRSEP